MDTLERATKYMNRIAIAKKIPLRFRSLIVDSYTAGCKDTFSLIENGADVSNIGYDKYRQVYGEITLEKIIDVVCEVMELPLYKFHDKRRKQELVLARYIYFYIAYNIQKWTLKKIGGAIKGGVDHSTVIHGRDSISDFISINDFHVQNKVMICRNKLGLI